MAKINLLPWREAKRKEQQQEFFTLVGAGAGGNLPGSGSEIERCLRGLQERTAGGGQHRLGTAAQTYPECADRADEGTGLWRRV